MMKQQQKILTAFFVIIIVGGLLYYLLNNKPGAAPSGNPLSPKTKGKGGTPKGNTVKGGNDNMQPKIDTSGNINIGDTIVCHSAFHADVVEPDPITGYRNALNADGSLVQGSDFALWDVIGTVDDIQYGTGNAEDYALVKIPAPASWNPFAATQSPNQYYKCPFDNIEAQ